MINQTTATKLVKIYLTTCQKYDNYLQYFCQRFSNNNKPKQTATLLLRAVAIRLSKPLK